jgi:hypothetical protein
MNEKAALLFSLVVICHLHVPADLITPENPASIISDVGPSQQCEILNQDKYYGKGRCHCSLDNIRGNGLFSPADIQDPPQVFQ